MLAICCNSCLKSWRNLKRDTGRITKIKLLINEYNFEEINYPSEKGDWKIFEKNNLKIALNVLHAKKEKIYRIFVSKHNSNRENKVIL